ncbi:hypothetical protein ACHAWU_005633 [Discostella pseudostelligera]|uniref:Helicase-associated domain-containing protein n=1 Tax=Discostella pseudostelligera TaxID=259834 RepID=A0ABD3LWM4_9STRA
MEQRIYYQIKSMQRATMEPMSTEQQTMNDNRDDEDASFIDTGTSDTKASTSINTNITSENNTNMLIQSEASMYDMMDDGNEQLPPDHYLLRNDWSPPELPFNFPPMPPLLPPNEFPPMPPLPPMQMHMPPLLVQTTTETTPPIARNFSHLSFEGGQSNTYSPSLDDFLPVDMHLDHSTIGGLHSDRNVPSLGISHPSSVCLPSLDETQCFAGNNAMQDANYSTPAAKFASVQNTTDEDQYDYAFSLSEAAMEMSDDDIAPGIDAAAKKAPLLSPWSQKFIELQMYKAQHGDCDVKQTEGKLGYWVNKQRNEKKLLDDGKPSQMTPQRMRLLTKIGFKWPEPRVQIWDKHFNELVAYKNRVRIAIHR